MNPVYQPHIVQRHVPSHGGKMAKHLGLTLHVQDGNNSCFGEFNNIKNEKSSNWWVSKVGVIEEYVPHDVEAWAQAAGNMDYNSVETEGFPYEELTLLQVAGLSWLYRHFQFPLAVVDKVGQQGFICHSDGGVPWGNHPSCPGHYRAAERITIVTLASGKSADAIGPHLRAEVAAFKRHHGLRADAHIGSAVRRLLGIY